MLRYFLISILFMNFFNAVYGCLAIPVLLDFTKLGVDIAEPNLERAGNFKVFNLPYRLIPINKD